MEERKNKRNTRIMRKRHTQRKEDKGVGKGCGRASVRVGEGGEDNAQTDPNLV